MKKKEPSSATTWRKEKEETVVSKRTSEIDWRSSQWISYWNKHKTNVSFVLKSIARDLCVYVSNAPLFQLLYSSRSLPGFPPCEHQGLSLGSPLSFILELPMDSYVLLFSYWYSFDRFWLSFSLPNQGVFSSVSFFFIRFFYRSTNAFCLT